MKFHICLYFSVTAFTSIALTLLLLFYFLCNYCPLLLLYRLIFVHEELNEGLIARRKSPARKYLAIFCECNSLVVTQILMPNSY